MTIVLTAGAQMIDKNRLLIGLCLVFVLAGTAGVVDFRYSTFRNLFRQPQKKSGLDAKEAPTLSEPLIIRLDGGSASRDLGTITVGKRSSTPIILLNPSNEPIKVESVQTSCECVILKLSQTQVASCERISGEIVLDMSHTPLFRGNLLLALLGVAPDGRKLFQLRLDVSVR